MNRTNKRAPAPISRPCKPQPTPSDLVEYVLETEYEDFMENEEPDDHVYAIAMKYRDLIASAPEMFQLLTEVYSSYYSRACNSHDAKTRDLIGALIARIDGEEGK